MKKQILILFLAVLGIAVQTNAQSVTTFKANADGTGAQYVVNGNTATSVLKSPALSGNSYLFDYTVQVWGTNASGTAGANVMLKCSLDSTNWDNIYNLNSYENVVGQSLGNINATVQNGVDTMVYAATRTCKVFKIIRCGCKYIEVSATGVGTHSDTFRALGSLQYIR